MIGPAADACMKIGSDLEWAASSGCGLAVKHRSVSGDWTNEGENAGTNPPAASTTTTKSSADSNEIDAR